MEIKFDNTYFYVYDDFALFFVRKMFEQRFNVSTKKLLNLNSVKVEEKMMVFTLVALENAILSRKTTDIGAGAVKRTHAHAIILI